MKSYCSAYKISAGGVVSDNHSANIAAFKILFDKYDADKLHYFTLPDVSYKTYVFVNFPKNVRNNLLNAKKLVFPEFDFNVCDIKIASSPGYIVRYDIHVIYDLKS